jgi:hypothetical protein
MREIRSLDDAIKIFSTEIARPLTIDPKNGIVLDKRTYGANVYNGVRDVCYGAMVIVIGDDGLMKECAYRGEHPLLKKDNHHPDSEKRTTLILSLVRKDDRYLRGDRNPTNFIGVEPAKDEEEVIFPEVEESLKHEDLK